MKFKKNLRCLLFCLVLFPDAPLASAEPQAPPPVNVSLELDIVAWGDAIEGLRIHSNGKEQPVSALAFEYSKATSYTGASVLEIAKGPAAVPASSNAYARPAPQTNPDDGGKPPGELEKRRLKNPNLVALAYLPSGSRRATILIAPAANGTYQTVVIDDDPSKLPPGQLRIHNYSPIPIAIRCGRKESAQLKVKQSTLVSPVDKNVIYELAYQKDGKWKMQENNAIQVSDAEQVQMVILRSDADFFTSGDGSRGGFLQTVVLRRSPK